MSSFGSRLRSLRKEKKLTAKKLGQEFGLAESTISGYENGNRSPDIKLVNQFADFFGVSTDYLLGRTDNPTPINDIEIIASHHKEDPISNITPEGLDLFKRIIEPIVDREVERRLREQQDKYKK